MDVDFLIPFRSHHWNFTPKALQQTHLPPCTPFALIEGPQAGAFRDITFLCLKGLLPNESFSLYLW